VPQWAYSLLSQYNLMQNKLLFESGPPYQGALR
jgi:hypothetical protein